MESNYINLIGNELNKAQSEEPSNGDNIGILYVRTANRVMADAYSRPNPEPLWSTLWFEGEVCCLFADSNLGKSIYAVQIADHIAKSRNVILFDFELSDKQFQLRYTDDRGNMHIFPDTLYRVEINPQALNGSEFEDIIITDIEDCAIKYNAQILIIDNLTYLCNASEKSDSAGILMMRLMQLKRKYGLSILILAHTPKRPLTNPITQNDLAGSKKLFNFFDSVFAIGRSAKDPSLRYIKQIKVRNCACTYDADNVIVCEIEKTGTFLKFNRKGFSEECEHLSECTHAERESIKIKAKDLYSKGLTLEQISKQIGKSKSTVERYVKM